MKDVLLYLSFILIITIMSLGFTNENFSSSDEKELDKKVQMSENKMISIIKNIIQDTKKFPIIEGPPGPQGPHGPSSGDGPLPPQFMYNETYEENKMMSVQGKLSNSDPLCNISYMLDKASNAFDIGNNSKWTLIKGDADYFKIQSYDNPEKCLSYDDNKKVFLAKCDDKIHHSNWKQKDKQYEAENITDKVTNQCLTIGSISSGDKKKCSIPSEISNVLKLDGCSGEGKVDAKQSWLFN